MTSFRLRRCLLSAALAITACAAAAQPDSTRVSALIDALGPLTQAGADDDWKQQRAAEAAVAKRIRELTATKPGNPELTEGDRQGRTPLVRAALRGYADVVDALLADPGVKDAIDKRDVEGLSAWMAAQFGRPMTFASCHPQVLVREAVALWRPALRRIGYFQQDTMTAFDRIRMSLATARATPDPDGAKSYWLAQCPGHDPALEPEIAASKNLLATLVQDSDKRIQAFGNELATKLGRPPNTLPPQPVINLNRLVAQDPLALPTSRSLACTSVIKPDIMNLNLPNGMELRFKLSVEIQDGVPIAAGVQMLNNGGTISADNRLYLRASAFNALGGYRCPGDMAFEQEFRYTVGR